MTKDRLDNLSKGAGVPLSVVVGAIVFVATSLFAGQKYLDERISVRLEIFTQKFDAIEKRQDEMTTEMASTARDIVRQQQWIIDNIIEIQRSLGEQRGLIQRLQ